MKREEVKSIIEGITDEQLDKLMNLNNADIEKAKGKLQTQLDTAQNELKEAKETIATLESNTGDTAALQAEIEKYKQAEEQRQKEAKAAEAKAAMEARFTAVLGDKKFTSDYARAGVFSKFSDAVADPANTGKGDAELFASLTKDVDGIFQSANPGVYMPGVKPTADPAEPTTLAGALRERYKTN